MGLAVLYRRDPAAGAEARGPEADDAWSARRIGATDCFILTNVGFTALGSLSTTPPRGRSHYLTRTRKDTIRRGPQQS